MAEQGRGAGEVGGGGTMSTIDRFGQRTLLCKWAGPWAQFLSVRAGLLGRSMDPTILGRAVHSLSLSLFSAAAFRRFLGAEDLVRRIPGASHADG